MAPTKSVKHKKKSAKKGKTKPKKDQQVKPKGEQPTKIETQQPAWKKPVVIAIWVLVVIIIGLIVGLIVVNVSPGATPTVQAFAQLPHGANPKATDAPSTPSPDSSGIGAGWVVLIVALAILVLLVLFYAASRGGSIQSGRRPAVKENELF